MEEDSFSRSVSGSCSPIFSGRSDALAALGQGSECLFALQRAALPEAGRMRPALADLPGSRETRPTETLGGLGHPCWQIPILLPWSRRAHPAAPRLPACSDVLVACLSPPEGLLRPCLFSQGAEGLHFPPLTDCRSCNVPVS